CTGCTGSAGGAGRRGGTRRPRIENDRLVSLASSGPMATAIDLAIARRFTAPGMRRFRRGASPLLHVRLLRLDVRLDRLAAQDDLTPLPRLVDHDEVGPGARPEGADAPQSEEPCRDLRR